MMHLVGSSPQNPIPLGSTVKKKIERGDPYSSPEIYDVEITILELYRGEEARERIKAMGVSNDMPKAGFEDVLALVKFGYFRRGRGFTDEPYRVKEGHFLAVSADGKTIYDPPAILQGLQPQLVNRVFKIGESQKCWLHLQVRDDERQPLLIFRRESDEGVYGFWGDIWFTLY
jgi:hypothetical protein